MGESDPSSTERVRQHQLQHQAKHSNSGGLEALMHRGGPNDSGETRALLYLTFGRRWFKDHNALSAFDPARSTFGGWW